MSASSNLWRAVERARKDPFFVGWTLAAYEKLHALEKRQVAEQLQCAPEALDRIALCRQPRGAEPAFQAQVRRIAAYGPCNADRLVQIVREVAALVALQEATADSGGNILLAARDRRHGQKNRHSGRSEQEGET